MMLRYFAAHPATLRPLLDNEQRFAMFSANAPIAMFETDAAGSYAFVNERWTVLTGIDLADALGTGWIAALHEGDRERVVRDWNAASQGGLAFRAEYRFVDRAGRVSWVVGDAAPLRDPDGNPIGYLGTATDITERKEMEEVTRRALQEKETLLKEIHHRVKNNLQVVSSLLGLQATHVSDPAARAAFEETQGRVRSIALLHEKLYGAPDLVSLDMEQYLRELVAGVTRALSGRGRPPVTMNVHTSQVLLDLEHAVPCGLIMNELVTNALKHAFDGLPRADAQVEVSITAEGGDVRLAVSDNGRGLPAALDFRTTQTMGLHLVRTLTRQLRGTLDIRCDAGTLCTVTFAWPPVRSEMPQ